MMIKTKISKRVMLVMVMILKKKSYVFSIDITLKYILDILKKFTIVFILVCFCLYLLNKSISLSYMAEEIITITLGTSNEKREDSMISHII
jgi:hypothetical protein